MKFTVFYSWQSDLPGNTNRGLIDKALRKAAKSLNSTTIDLEEPSERDSPPLTVEIDRDTQGRPGSPNIAHTILDKIDQADIFVADVSIVTGGGQADGRNLRLSPNPNVLIELGYAMARLGRDRIILVLNEEYGSITDLPFDIRQDRTITYRLKQEDLKAPERNRLTSIFSTAIQTIIRESVLKQNLTIDSRLEVAFASSGREESTVQKLTLYRLPAPENIETRIEQQIAELQDVSAAWDSTWDKKRSKYIEDARLYVSQMKDPKSHSQQMFRQHRSFATPLILSVYNSGVIPVHDIRVRLPLASENILAFEDWHFWNDDLVEPDVPRPKPKPHPTNPLLDFGLSHSALLVQPFLQSPSLESHVGKGIYDISTKKRTSGQYLDENREHIIFWADRLLHKHELSHSGDAINVMANHQAPDTFTVSVGLFCEEFNDWEDVELTFVVKDIPE